jgi:hypothetical protein
LSYSAVKPKPNNNSTDKSIIPHKIERSNPAASTPKAFTLRTNTHQVGL